MNDKILALKYRPKLFNEVIGQDLCVQSLSNSISLNKLHNAYLFSGTRGVGKTTIARAFAKSLLCETGITNEPCGKCNSCIEIDKNNNLDLIEIDAASRTKVEDTRNLMENVQYAPTSSRFKIYLIDEVHMLSTKSFNALLKTIEEPPEHVKFLLATTEPQKLPETIISRCLHFKLKPITGSDLSMQIENVLNKEKIKYEDNVPGIIASAAKGSARDAMSILEQCISFTNGNLDNKSVSELLGLIDAQIIDMIIEHLINDEYQSLRQYLNESNIGNYTQLLDMLIEKVVEISLARKNCKTDINLPATLLNENVTIQELQVWYSILLNAKETIHSSPSAHNHILMTLLRVNVFTEYKNVRGTDTDNIENLGNTEVSKKKVKTIANKDSIESKNKFNFIKENLWEETINKMNINGLMLDLANNSILSLDDSVVLYIDSSKNNTYPKNCIQKFLDLIVMNGLSNELPIVEYIENIPTLHKKNIDNNIKSKNDMFDAVKDNKILKEIESIFDAKIDKNNIDKVN